jgi:O-antigen/teichoic acid export membrane protein
VYLPKRAGQIAAYQRGDVPEHRRQSLAIVKEVSIVTAGMMLLGAAALLAGHGYLNQPLISAHLGVGLLLLLGMWSRISVDTLAYGLFTAGRDKVFLGSTLLAIGLAWVLNLLLVPLWGLYGAALSFIVVALGLGLWRGLQLKDVWK